MTVDHLLAFPTIDRNRATGVGLKVRREVLDAIGRLRTRFDADVADPAASIDRLAAQLVPKPTTAQSQADAPALTIVLGLHGADMPHLPLDAGDVTDLDAPAALAWPGAADLSQAARSP